MKVTVAPWRLIRVYLILGLFFGIFFYLIPGFAFPPTQTHWFIMGVWFVTTLIYILVGIFTNYYKIEKDGILQHRFTKNYFFRYDEIIYVDEEYTKKHKTLRFVTNQGQLQFLLLDKNELIYAEVKKKCDLINEEEMNRRFPRLKI